MNLITLFPLWKEASCISILNGWVHQTLMLGCQIIKFTIMHKAQYRNYFYNVLCMNEAKEMDIIVRNSVKTVGKQCTGCGLCEQVCHVSAISITEDKKGFLYPIINDNICIDCGMCIKSCPSSNKVAMNDFEPEVFLAYNKDQNILKRSTSGGVFYNLAAEIIRGGGIAYGATYTEDFYVQHDGVENICDIEKFHGSKYVQSDIRNCYSSIKSAIMNHRQVLFSGTACEIVAIREYCKLNHLDEELLTTVEIICWAVPSPGLFRNHVDLLQKSENSKLIAYSFRDKKDGWGSYIRSAVFANGHSARNNLLLQSDGQLYSKKYNMRESCFTGKYKKIPKVADITIGDC